MTEPVRERREWWSFKQMHRGTGLYPRCRVVQWLLRLVLAAIAGVMIITMFLYMRDRHRARTQLNEWTRKSYKGPFGGLNETDRSTTGFEECDELDYCESSKSLLGCVCKGLTVVAWRSMTELYN